MELSLPHMMKTNEDERVGLQHAWHMGKNGGWEGTGGLEQWFQT